MRRIAGLGVALLLLAGCGDDKTKTAQSSDLPARLIPATSNVVSTKEQCDAKALAYLVGKPRSSIPVAVEPSSRRVSCSTCPMADDFRPQRTNILFDAKTGLILSVSCG